MALENDKELLHDSAEHEVDLGRPVAEFNVGETSSTDRASYPEVSDAMPNHGDLHSLFKSDDDAESAVLQDDSRSHNPTSNGKTGESIFSSTQGPASSHDPILLTGTSSTAGAQANQSCEKHAPAGLQDQAIIYNHCCRNEASQALKSSTIGNTEDHHEAQSARALRNPTTVETRSVDPGSLHADIEILEEFEHVVLAVEGMDCSGCGSHVKGALEATPGVSQVQVNFVAGKVDFTLNTRVMAVGDAIRITERVSGFRCMRQGGGYQSIDLIMSKNSIQRLKAIDIPGLIDVFPLSHKQARLQYNPANIGARTLVCRVGDLSQGLASNAENINLLQGRKRLFEIFILATLAAILTIPVVVIDWGSFDMTESTKGIVSLVLASLVQLIAIPEFYLRAFRSLIRSRVLEMDMLVVMSITAAYIYSVVALGFRMAGEPLEIAELFETSTLLITFVLLGRLAGAYARSRAIRAVSVRSLQATTAVVIEDGIAFEMDARLLQFGDRLKIYPHSQIPTDGLVTHGASEVDESMLTGESLPIKKEVGAKLIAGTLNGSGTLVAEITRLPGRNTITDIAGLVEQASGLKPRIQDIADHVASYFVPIIAGVPAIVFVVWTLVNLRGRQQSVNRSLASAVTYTVAVLAVSCPCALGLAVPMVLMVAAGIAARGGVIIKSAQSTVLARKITNVVLDKTGTITEAELDIVSYQTFLPDPQEALSLARALVCESRHPVSVAVNRLLEAMHVEAATINGACSIPGDGVVAVYEEAIIKAGNPQWTRTGHHSQVAQAIANGLTVLTVTRDSSLLAIFSLKSRLRLGVLSVVNDLRRRGLTVHLVSGDQQAAVEAIASEVNIPLENVSAHRTPDQKRTYVTKLMNYGKVVLFCGDGTNDAPAVAQASVGVQMGTSLSSSDVTRGAADVVLLSGLSGITHLIEVSKSAYSRILFNFVWAAVYNVLAVLLAAGAFVRFRIPPAYAGLGELVSVLPVILAALTLLFHKRA